MKISYHKHASNVLYYLACMAVFCGLAIIVIALVASVALIVVRA
jgi:hypothetical protein